MSFYFVTDTETGGLRPGRHSLLEVALAAVVDGVIKDQICLKVKREEYIVTPDAMGVNKIDLKELAQSGWSPDQVVEQLIYWLEQTNIAYGSEEKPILLGHNVDFDRRFIMALFDEIGVDLDSHLTYHTVDTAAVIRYLKDIDLLPRSFPVSLQKATKALGRSPVDEHTADGDVKANIYLYEALKEIGKGQIIVTEIEKGQYVISGPDVGTFITQV